MTRFLPIKARLLTGSCVVFWNSWKNRTNLLTAHWRHHLVAVCTVTMWHDDYMLSQCLGKGTIRLWGMWIKEKTKQNRSLFTIMMNYQKAELVANAHLKVYSASFQTTERMLFLQSERPVTLTTIAARGFQEEAVLNHCQLDGCVACQSFRDWPEWALAKLSTWRLAGKQVHRGKEAKVKRALNKSSRSWRWWHSCRRLRSYCRFST